MADDPKPSITPEEKPEEKKDDVPYIAKIRNSTFADLANPPKPKEKPEEKPKETLKEEPKTEEPKVDIEALKREQAELAARTAAEVLAKQEEARKAEQERVKAEEDRKAAEERRKEALKPRFTGVDKDGNPVPKDYDEFTSESARIGKEQALAEFEERQRVAAERAKAEAEEKAKLEATQKEEQIRQAQAIQQEIDDEITELFSTGKLPKIVNKDDPNDAGNLALQELLKQGAEYNQQRIKEGKQPIRSIARFYLSYYKSPKLPAGHNAPVMGDNPPAGNTGDVKGYDFKRYHNMSPGQFLRAVSQREGSQRKAN